MRYARTIAWACVVAAAVSFGGVAGAAGYAWTGQGQNPWQQGSRGPAYVQPSSPQAAFNHNNGGWRSPVTQPQTWFHSPARPPVTNHRFSPGYRTFVPGRSGYYAPYTVPYTQTYSQGWCDPNWTTGYGWRSGYAYNAAFQQALQQAYQQGYQAGYAQAMQECGR